MRMSSVRSVAPQEADMMLETVVVVFHLLGAIGVVALVLLLHTSVIMLCKW